MSGYDVYRSAVAQTASPAQLVLMLFDGAIMRIERAIRALEDPRDLSAVHEAITRAQRIVDELSMSLDHEGGGQLAGNLAAIYTYVGERLTTANIQKHPEPLEEAIAHLTPLRDAWESACVRVEPVSVAG